MKAAVFLFLPMVAFAGDPGRGKEIVLGRGDGNCLLCHAIPGTDRPAGNLGPSLAGVGSRLGADELRSRLVDASRFNPKSVMPPYGRVAGLHAVAPQFRGKPLLTDQEIEDAVAFMLTLR